MRRRGEFVEGLLAEAEERIKRQLAARELERRSRKIVEGICAKEKVGREAVASGSRRGRICRTRPKLAEALVEDVGLSLAECARQLGVTTSAIAQILKRRKYS
jgi:putative transposase